MLNTLRTLMRARAAEAEEAVIDANGTTLLAQHLRDARADVERSRHACATLMARKASEARRVEEITAEIAKREPQARAALKADNERLAAEVADRIVVLEDQRAQGTEAIEKLDGRIEKLRTSLADADRKIAHLVGELKAARSGALSRRVMGQINEPCTGSALNQAEEMAQRVRGTEAWCEDKSAALSELRRDPAGLDDSLSKAGHPTPDEERRKAVLARLSGDKKSKK